MKCEGGCYCGEMRYVTEGEPRLMAQCHCRECQYFSGGGVNLFMMMPTEGFDYLSGTPHSFQRTDLENAVTREFCGTCGTHIVTRITGRDYVVLKIGTLDDPTAYTGPQIAIYTVDQQPFHHIAAGVPSFERIPDRG